MANVLVTSTSATIAVAAAAPLPSSRQENTAAAAVAKTLASTTSFDRPSEPLVFTASYRSSLARSLAASQLTHSSGSSERAVRGCNASVVSQIGYEIARTASRRKCRDWELEAN